MFKLKTKSANSEVVFIRGAHTIEQAVKTGKFYIYCTFSMNNIGRTMPWYIANMHANAIFIAGCQRLEVEEDQDLKLYTTDGVRLFDDDLQDDAWIKEKTLIMSTTAPVPFSPLPTGHQQLPSLSTPSHSSDDTMSLVSTPDSSYGIEGDCDKSSIVILPTFSTWLDRELRSFGNKNCNTDCWKKVS